MFIHQLNVNTIGDNQFFVDGCINTLTADKLRDTLSENAVLDRSLILDFSKVCYISAAGLRILFDEQYRRRDQSNLILVNVSQMVKDILCPTGLDALLNMR